MIIKFCKICGNKFFTYPVYIRKGGGFFCSQICYGKSIGDKFPRKCKLCGKKFVAFASVIRKGYGIFCSPSCRSKFNNTGKPMNEKTKKAMAQARSHKLHGKGNPMWKGGKIIHSAGYIWIYMPKHPLADKRKYVFEHRLVMEKKLGRYLTEDEVVHHKNQIKTDNRIPNLIVMSKSEHMRLHKLKS